MAEIEVGNVVLKNATELEALVVESLTAELKEAQVKGFQTARQKAVYGRCFDTARTKKIKTDSKELMNVFSKLEKLGLIYHSLRSKKSAYEGGKPFRYAIMGMGKNPDE